MTVLSLHRISDERNYFWNPIRPKTFDQLLSYVKKNYHLIAFNELEEVSGSEPKKPLLILSFDDGYRDFYEHALPLLVKHGLPSNHNVVNACADTNSIIWTERLNIIFEHCRLNAIDLELEFEGRKIGIQQFNGSWMPFYIDTFKTLLSMERAPRTAWLDQLQGKMGIATDVRMMNWDEIRDCAANGVEIGCHTYHHDALGTIRDKDVLRKEILQAKAEIETEIGKKVTVLALPNGQTGALADSVISNSDHKFVLYANDELNIMPLIRENGPLPISRINLIDEPFPQMVLRMEQFHKKLRKYV